jgi:hypothetical protein
MAPTSRGPSLDYVLKFNKDNDIRVEYGTTSVRTPTTLPASKGDPGHDFARSSTTSSQHCIGASHASSAARHCADDGHRGHRDRLGARVRHALDGVAAESRRREPGEAPLSRLPGRERNQHRNVLPAVPGSRASAQRRRILVRHERRVHVAQWQPGDADGERRAGDGQERATATDPLDL